MTSCIPTDPCRYCAAIGFYHSPECSPVPEPISSPQPTDPRKNQWAKGLQAQPTGDGRDITPEDDEHIAWFNSGFRAGYQKAKRESAYGRKLHEQYAVAKARESQPIEEFDELDRYNAKPIQPTGQSKDCETCGGKGYIEYYLTSDKYSAADVDVYDCDECNGTGKAPQPNTDSLDIAETLAYHLDGSTEQPGFTDAVEALQQLFNKYAREQVIAELMAIMSRHDDIEAKGGIPVPLLMVANRLAELKEQRAKLKEEK